MEKSISVMVESIVGILSNNNPSIYLFGSILFNDFKLGWSDIDILCLVEKQISTEQANELLNLRQALLVKEPQNPYYRLFEGGILTLDSFLGKKNDKVVYWGTRGQRITEQYYLDVFSTIELLDNGKLVYGSDIRDLIEYPKKEEVIKAIKGHYNTIRTYAVKTDQSLYSAGWMLDIARCLYTLETGKIIGKTSAGEWALENNLCPEPYILEKVVEIRKDPLRFKNDDSTKQWLETLGPYIQNFADVLEKSIKIHS